MFIAKHLRGATSFLVLGAAVMVPMSQVHGEVAKAQLAPQTALVQDGDLKSLPKVTVPVNAEGTIQKADQADSEAPAKQVGLGVASFYGNELAGNRTASGERFDPTELTAAHRTLPLGTKLRVTNLSNGKSVVVRVNDRGPFAKARILDLSHAAAQEISMVHKGTARVKLELI